MAAGVLDVELLAQYRKAKGEKRRAIGGRLFQENLGLVKLLLDQVLGRGAAQARSVRLPGAGTKGFRELEWDEAFAAASIAFLKALDQFDPARGKISSYLKFKIIYELQCLISREGLARSDRGDGGVDIALTGEQEVLDRLGGSEESGPVAVEGITADDIAEWDRTGEWPEDLEELRAQREAERVARLPPDGRGPLQRFLEDELEFRPRRRVLRSAVVARFEVVAFGLPLRRGTLHRALIARNVTEVRIWEPGVGPRRGYEGVALRSPTRNGGDRNRAESLTGEAAA